MHLLLSCSLRYVGFLPLCIYVCMYVFIEKGEEREKERERNINIWLPLTSLQTETRPLTQACALTGNWTSDPLVYRLALIHWATKARRPIMSYTNFLKGIQIILMMIHTPELDEVNFPSSNLGERIWFLSVIFKNTKATRLHNWSWIYFDDFFLS